MVTLVKSNSSWVCRYQAAQVLDRQKVQRIASERLALSCLVSAERSDYPAYENLVPNGMLQCRAGYVAELFRVQPN